MDTNAFTNVRRERSAEPRNLLFHAPWWLDVAGQGRCEAVRVHWDGLCVGQMTFLPSRRFGLTLLRMPPYTRTLEPLIVPPHSKPYQERSNIRRILQALLAQLPKHDQLLLALSPYGNPALALAFDIAGLHVGAAYTFVASPGDGLDAIWAGMDQKTRNLVRSAGRACSVVQSADFDRFEALSRREHETTPSRPHGTTHDYPILRALHAHAACRGQSTILFAAQEGGDAAAIILVWDGAAMYYWTSARDCTRPGGASALLVWHALGLAHGRGLALDLDSYASPATARFLSSFGLPPVVRPVVEEASPRFRAAQLARDGLRRFRGFN